MAHHGSTPDSVLNAPKLTPKLAYASKGLSRAERRGQQPVSLERRMKTFGKKATPFTGSARDELFEAPTVEETKRALRSADRLVSKLQKRSRR